MRRDHRKTHTLMSPGFCSRDARAVRENPERLASHYAVSLGRLLCEGGTRSSRSGRIAIGFRDRGYADRSRRGMARPWTTASPTTGVRTAFPRGTRISMSSPERGVGVPIEYYGVPAIEPHGESCRPSSPEGERRSVLKQAEELRGSGRSALSLDLEMISTGSSAR